MKGRKHGESLWMRNGGCGVPDGGTVWPRHFSGLARLRFCEAFFVSFSWFGDGSLAKRVA